LVRQHTTVSRQQQKRMVTLFGSSDRQILSSRILCVPKTRFGNIGDEGRRGQVEM